MTATATGMADLLNQNRPAPTFNPVLAVIAEARRENWEVHRDTRRSVLAAEVRLPNGAQVAIMAVDSDLNDYVARTLHLGIDSDAFGVVDADDAVRLLRGMAKLPRG